jgi:hypothetical protein
MIRIAIFTETKWAFGSLNSGLIKELYKHGVFGDLLDWSQSYDPSAVAGIVDMFDYVITGPTALLELRSYGFPYEKIILIAHGQIDIYNGFKRCGVECFDRVHELCVVSPELVDVCKEVGVRRTPRLTPVGVSTGFFNAPISKELKTVGYASAIAAPNVNGADIKRGHLVKEICKRAKLHLVCNDKPVHYLSMYKFYKTVDCVICSSTEETVGLPMLEGATAGKLLMSTPIGYVSRNKNAILLPSEENAFVEMAVQKLDYYRNHPIEYQVKCNDFQSYALNHYDWKHVIHHWLGIFH